MFGTGHSHGRGALGVRASLLLLFGAGVHALVVEAQFGESCWVK